MEKTNGIVKWFNDAKGYGFLSTDSVEGEVFVHYSAIVGDGFKTLAEGQKVKFDLVKANNGYQAWEVVKESLE